MSTPETRLDQSGGADATARGAYDQESNRLLDELRTRHRRFVWPWSIVFFVFYMTFVAMSGTSVDLYAKVMFGRVINFGMVFAVANFALVFFITWLYTRYANRKLDPLAEQLRERMAHRGGAR